MANNPIVPPQNLGPTTEEAFVADRVTFFGHFTRFVTLATIALVVLLILMRVFLA